MSLNNHAERLRRMAAGWLREAETAKTFGNGSKSNKSNIAHYNAQAAALLAGAEALERLERVNESKEESI